MSERPTPPLLDGFLTALRASQIVGEERLAPIIAAAGSAGPAELATQLVAAGVLSRWQADYLLSGQAALRVGNYLLTGRTGQDALGERFSAVQESLGRTVELQVLPEAMTAGDENIARFLATARKLTRFDHPAVLHLYDIAEHKGRLFMVSERFDPTGASDSPVADDASAARLGAVRSLLDAVRQIHAEGFTHGSLDARSVKLGYSGLPRIDGLAVNVLQRELVSRSMLETDDGRRMADWNAVATIAGSWLGDKPSSAGLTPAHHQALLKALGELKSSSDPSARAEAIADRITSLLASLEVTALSRNAKPASLSKPLQPATPTQAGRAKTAAAPDRTVRSSPGKKSSGIPAANQLPSKTRSRWAIPTAISLLTMTALALGWVVFFRDSTGSTRKPGKGEPLTAANRGPTSGQSAMPNRAPESSPEARTAPESTSSKVEENGLPDDDDPVAGQLASTDQRRMPETESSARPETAEVTREPSDVELDVAVASGPEATPAPGDAASPAPAVPPAVQDPAPSYGGKPDPFLIPGGSPAPSASPGTTLEPPLGADSQAPTNASPVADLPVTADLRDAAMRETQQLFPLPPAYASDALELSLESDPDTMGKGKNFFRLRSAGDGWDVHWSRKEDDEEQISAGRFGMDADQQLTFVWDAAIDAEHAANCLVNATLVLRAGDRVHRVGLREPIPFAGPAIDPETLDSEVKIEIPWLPKSEAVTVELGELYAEAGWGAGTMVENATFADKQPAGIFLKATPPERLIWLALDAEIKARTEFRFQVQTLAGGKVTNLKARDFSALIESLQANQVAWQARVAQAEQNYQNAVYGTKGDMEDAFKQAKKDLAAAVELTQIGFEHETWIKGLMGKPLPLRIIYSTGERSVELARSTGWEQLPSTPASSRND